jgi:hypothetical protein
MDVDLLNHLGGVCGLFGLGKIFPDSVLEAVDCPACSTLDEHCWTEEYCLPAEERLDYDIGWQGDGVGGRTCQRPCGWSGGGWRGGGKFALRLREVANVASAKPLPVRGIFLRFFLV